MGLDMYLYCNSKKVCKEVNDHEDAMEGEFCIPRGIAIYWRKANAIHKWFVDNIQGGKDDCGLYEVGVDELVKLHDLCREVLDSTELVDDGTVEVYDLKQSKMVEKTRQVLADDSVARKLLPTEDGFFFGDTDYDMWYWWDIQYTERKLAALLDCVEPKDQWHVVHKDESDWYVTFTYHSSW